MKVLVLGGSHFVGRALVEIAIERGHDVTTLNRGLMGTSLKVPRSFARTEPTTIRSPQRSSNTRGIQ